MTENQQESLVREMRESMPGAPKLTDQELWAAAAFFQRSRWLYRNDRTVRENLIDSLVRTIREEY